jgi:hypothetical protein
MLCRKFTAEKDGFKYKTLCKQAAVAAACSLWNEVLTFQKFVARSLLTYGTVALSLAHRHNN